MLELGGDASAGGADLLCMGERFLEPLRQARDAQAETLPVLLPSCLLPSSRHMIEGRSVLRGMTRCSFMSFIQPLVGQCFAQSGDIIIGASKVHSPCEWTDINQCCTLESKPIQLPSYSGILYPTSVSWVFDRATVSPPINLPSVYSSSNACTSPPSPLP